MLNKLIQWSLDQRYLVLVLMLVLLGLGIRSALTLPVEVLPDLTKPTVTVLTESPGFSPEEVETLVTVPLENALMGVSGVSRLRSVNDVGLSLIFVEFDWGTDIYRARQFVQERLMGSAVSLPENVTPYLTPVASLMGNILLVGLVDPENQLPSLELRSLADWTIARRIQSIPGIAEVLAMGGGVKQLQIQPLPDRMMALGVRFDELREAASKAVKNSNGGFLEESSREIMVRNLAMTTDPDAIGDTVVSHINDRPIRIKDVAKIVWATEPMRGDAGMGSRHLEAEAPRGYPGVILSITKSPGFDTLELTSRVEEALKSLQASLPKGVRLVTIYRQADYIDIAIGNLESALRDGAIMVAVVLFMFLLNFRITLITLTAIPLSLAVTLLVFQGFGLTVNSMTLGGLAVAIGMVVDDAIVDVENVFRRLRENARLEVPRDRLKVIAAASTEVRSSIFYATLLVILVFIPLLSLRGVEGKLFTPIAVATIVSMASSFVVSLTVIPALCSLLLHPKGRKKRFENVIEFNLKRLFGATWLRLSLSQPLLVILGTGALFAISIGVLFQMGGNFLPAFREPTVMVAMTTAPGTSLKQTRELAETALQLLLQVPDVETVGYRVGRAERGDHVVPVSSVEFDVEFTGKPQRDRSEILADIRGVMQNIPGTFSAMSGPLADRIGHMLSGVSAKVAVKIFGPDLQTLRSLGAEVAEMARSVPGLSEAQMEAQASIPQLRIEVDRKRAMAYGITPGALNEQLSTLMGGEIVGQLYEDQRVYDLVVRLPQPWRESKDKLSGLYVDTLSGQRIPLSYVAHIRNAAGPNTIMRENTSRRFVVSINPTTTDLNQSVEELQSMIASRLMLPEGYSVAIEGEYEAQAQAKRAIVGTALLVGLLISGLLYRYFRSFVFVAMVFTIVPISLIGSIWLTHWTLNTVSIATWVGFIAVSGIAARNNIMLLSHYLHLMRNEGEPFGKQLLIRGTRERFIPVLITALSAGLALIPLMLATHEPGKEILNPIALVIVGGLVSSTLLGLGVTPAMVYLFGRRAALHSVSMQSSASE